MSYKIITRDIGKMGMPIVSQQEFETRRECVSNLPTKGTICRPERGHVYLIAVTKDQ